MSRYVRIDDPYELRDGIVRRVSRANGRVAIVELRDRLGVIELCTERAWVLDVGDRVAFLGRQDAKTGKFFAPCYRNITRGVQDHRSPEYFAVGCAMAACIATLVFWGGAQLGMPFRGTLIVASIPLLYMLFSVGALIDDLRYSRALRRHAAALAIA
ncbi:MAG: OB-fold nucleic acid binding domain-containing protein [Bacteroidota bacterium]